MSGIWLEDGYQAHFGISYEDACPNTWQNQEVQAVMGHGLLLPWVACVFSISYGNSLRARETYKIIPEQCFTFISGVCPGVLSVPMRVLCLSLSVTVCKMHACVLSPPSLSQVCMSCWQRCPLSSTPMSAGLKTTPSSWRCSGRRASTLWSR